MVEGYLHDQITNLPDEGMPPRSLAQYWVDSNIKANYVCLYQELLDAYREQQLSAKFFSVRVVVQPNGQKSFTFFPQFLPG